MSKSAEPKVYRDTDMKHRTLEYVGRIDACLSGETPVDDWDALLEEHLIQIGFFQHERLIHLLVTLTFALLAFATILAELISGYMPLMIVFFLLVVLLIPYIKHYFLMENKTQKMYAQYDRMLKIMKEKKPEEQ